MSGTGGGKPGNGSFFSSDRPSDRRVPRYGSEKPVQYGPTETPTWVGVVITGLHLLPFLFLLYMVLTGAGIL